MQACRKDTIWTPDGERIVYNGGARLMWTAADGTESAEVLVSAPSDRRLYPLSWTRDGGRLLFTDLSFGGTGYDVSIVGVSEDDRQPTYLVRGHTQKAPPNCPPTANGWRTTATNQAGSRSTSGHSLTWAVTESKSRPTGDSLLSGRPMALSCSISGVSTAPGRSRPAPNDQIEAGSFTGCERTAMMAVIVETDPLFKVGMPEQLFEETYDTYVGRQFDVDPNGQRFLMLKNEELTLKELGLSGFPNKTRGSSGVCRG